MTAQLTRTATTLWAHLSALVKLDFQEMAKSAKVRRRYFVFFSEPRITDKLRFFYYFSSFQTLHQKRLQPVRVPFHFQSYLWLQLRGISLDDWEYRFYLHTDIIECNTGSAKCHLNATCSDTIEGYICKCKDNMIGDGFLCVGGCFVILRVYIHRKLGHSRTLQYH